MNNVKRILAHLCLIFSLFFLILLVLNDYNPTMNFIANNISLALLATLCVLAFSLGLMTALSPGGGKEK